MTNGRMPLAKRRKLFPTRATNDTHNLRKKLKFGKSWSKPVRR